jgi:hypothetical protein
VAWATVLACLCSSSMLPISSSKKASQLAVPALGKAAQLRVHGLLAPS